jgi:integrase
LPLETIDKLVERFKLHSLGRTTREAYGYALVAFSAFCADHRLGTLPAEPATVCRFLTDYGINRKPPSLSTARAAIRWIHVHHEIFPSPTDHPSVGKVIEGHARLIGTAPKQKAALTADQIISMCELMDEDGGIAAIRDKANILLGFCGAFRGSETTSRDRHDDPEMGFFSLDLEHVTFSRFGMSILLVKSKTDQTANGLPVFVNYGLKKETCAVLALQNWIVVLKERGITTGPLFRAAYPRGDRLIGDAHIRDKALAPKSMLGRLKRWAKRIGLDPQTIGYHSLRSGHVTAAAGGGASIFSIAKQGRWKSLDTIMGYYRSATAHEDNSSSVLGL